LFQSIPSNSLIMHIAMIQINHEEVYAKPSRLGLTNKVSYSIQTTRAFKKFASLSIGDEEKLSEIPQQYRQIEHLLSQKALPTRLPLQTPVSNWSNLCWSSIRLMGSTNSPKQGKFAISPQIQYQIFQSPKILHLFEYAYAAAKSPKVGQCGFSILK